MANSIPDINLSGTWVDVYGATGIPIGTSIFLQNKASSAMLVYISPPSPGDTNSGYVLSQLETILVDPNES